MMASKMNKTFLGINDNISECNNFTCIYYD